MLLVIYITDVDIHVPKAQVVYDIQKIEKWNQIIIRSGRRETYYCVENIYLTWYELILYQVEMHGRS